MLIYKSESLERLRQRVDLAEVVSAHIPLRRAGAAFKALCPFHDEKTPSFTIQRGDTHYHCFGCGAHGDAIAFLMSHLNLSFVEAVENLADRFQVVLEKVDGGEAQRGPSKVELRQVLERACRFYHFALLHTEEGHEALHYLYDRGIDLDFIRYFHIGFALRTGDVLHKYLHEEGFSDELLEQTGLLSGKKRDFFFNRITFPIRDALGAVIGFSARKFKEEVFGGKYINTPETPLFKKSHILFGLSYSRQRIAKEKKAIVVEGQIDALRLIHLGFNFTVAGQGTAFGESHVKELAQLGVTQVYLALDGDEAGREATVKIGNLFQKKGIGVHVLALPQGLDPDALLKAGGPPAFTKLLDESGDYLSFLVKHFAKKFDPREPSGKTQLVDVIAQMIRGWDHPLMVHESLRRLAELLHVPEAVIGVGPALPAAYVKRAGAVAFAEIDPDRILETDVLRWLFLAGETLPKIVEIIQLNLTPAHFYVPVCQRLFSLYMDAFQRSAPCDFFSIAIASSHAEDQEFFSELMQKKINLQKAETGVIETIQKLLQRNWMQQREAITQKIQSGCNSDEEVLELARYFDTIKKQAPQVLLS